MRIVAEEVSKVFGEGEDSVVALDNFSLTVETGEFVSIVGPSGCGKSTFLEVAAGLTSQSGGRVLMDDDVVKGPNPSVGVVFQQDSTFPWRTVADNVSFGLEMRGIGKRERRKRAADIIGLVGLTGFEDRYPGQLSGGMRQRVALARTLVMNPEVILMDEPFGALDEQTRLILGDELLKIWTVTGATVLFITHSIEESILLSDRVIAMTARPGRTRRTVDVDLGRPRDSTLVGSPEFSRLTAQIWEVLREESMKTLAAQE